MKDVDLDFEAPLDVAQAAARQAGRILMDKFRHLKEVVKKGAVDLVTEADLASEAVIVAAIREAFPDHNILAEEGHYEQMNPSAPRWVIDPLDGTTNYVHGLPIFAVSIGYQVDGKTMVGLILNPARDEEYVAVRGLGATLNGNPIRVSKVVVLQEALLVTGFPYTHDEVYDRSFDLHRELYGRSQGVRRLGAAALDLCYVADGRFDAFYEANLKSWDVCAGDLICREAGGRTTDWLGGAMPFSGRRVLASNGRVHKELLGILGGPDYAGMR